MAVAVRLEDVAKRFGRNRAVDRVCLAIEPGELFFLLGPSGCGKTTLLRCVAGFCDPDAGRILIDDRDITHRPAHERDTGMVFQSYALWPHMTVRENIAFGLQMRRLSRAETDRRIDAVLDMVRMPGRGNDKPGQLSGGQQQRVALARALVIHPQCLLLDEPLSNLDAKLRVEMRTEVRRICKEAGLTAIYVTHDQKEALAAADRIAVMRDGRVEQVGRPREIYGRPANTFVAGFIGEANLVAGEIVSCGADACLARTAIGLVTARPPSDGRPEQGRSVTLCIRPEAIRLLDGGAGAGGPASPANAFDARIRRSVYLGEIAQHLLTVEPRDGASGLDLRVCELNPRSAERDALRPVRFQVDPADVVVLAP